MRYPIHLSFGFAIFSLTAIICNSCVSRPWRPTNVGHESGTESTPMMVSHLAKKNQWTIARTKPHNIFQHFICFNYVCRRLIGRNKLRQPITYKKYSKQVEKNAKKGVYKNLAPSTPAIPQPLKQKHSDTLLKAKDTVHHINAKPIPIAASAILKTDSLITLGDFLFETDSYKLKDNHYSQLDSLSKFLIRHPTLTVSIAGHTDNTGDEQYNVTLSLRRAEAVSQYLINKGISKDKLSFHGFGSMRPLQGNETESGKAKNRRVEILISNPKKK